MQVREKKGDFWFEDRFASFGPALIAAGYSIEQLLSCSTENDVHTIMAAIAVDKAEPYILAIKRVRKELDAEAKAAKSAPQPLWVRKCREAHGRGMQLFINDDGVRWDSYTFGKIMLAYMREAFARPIGWDELGARALINELVQTVQRRTDRAHEKTPTVAEVLDALSKMLGILRQCKLDSAAAHVQEILEEAQTLAREARRHETIQKAFAVSSAEGEKLELYRAMCDFEVRLRLEAGKFDFQCGTITFGGPSVVWAADRTGRIKAEAERLKRIAEARHWLFHSTSAQVEIRSVLVDMEIVLHRFRGLQHQSQPLTEDSQKVLGWGWTDELDSLRCTLDDGGNVHFDILMEIDGGGMSIPMSPDKWLVGRDDMIDQLCHALCQPDTQILLHGIQGVGKDMVAASVVQQDEIRGHAELQLQAWLQGSTE